MERPRAAMSYRAKVGGSMPSSGHTRLTSLRQVFFAFGKIAPPSLPALETSLSALPLFPTAEGPVNRHPAPHLDTGSELERRRQYSRFRTIRLSGTAD